MSILENVSTSIEARPGLATLREIAVGPSLSGRSMVSRVLENGLGGAGWVWTASSSSEVDSSTGASNGSSRGCSDSCGIGETTRTFFAAFLYSGICTVGTGWLVTFPKGGDCW